MNQSLGSTPITKKTKSYGDPNVHDKYRCLPRLCAPLLGSEPLSTCPALGFTSGFACAALHHSTEAVPSPWLSPSISISELPIMSSRNRWTWMKRMCLLLQMNIKRGMPSREPPSPRRGSDKWTYFSLTVHYWEGQFDDDYS